MTKTDLQKLVEDKLKDGVSDSRKRAIVASVSQALAFTPNLSSDLSFINSLIDKLSEKQNTTVISLAEKSPSCVRCNKETSPAYLHNSRKAFYCSMCRIVIPATAKE